jgi:hypothetical protein
MARKKYVCPYTFPHKSRAEKVKYICGIGGYHGDWGRQRWPIEFNIAADRCNMDLEHLSRLVEEDNPSPTDPTALLLRQEALHNAYEEHKEHLWDWGLEDAQRSLHEADTYKMLWDGVKNLDVEFEQQGRGGKHLVITRFEGVKLEGYTDEELAKALMLQLDGSGNGRGDFDDEPRLRKGYEWSYSNEWIDKFYRYVRQCEIDFTPEKASREVEYQAAFHRAIQAEAEEERLKALLDDRDEVAAAAQDILDAWPADGSFPSAAWRTLCLAAGLSPAALTA